AVKNRLPGLLYTDSKRFGLVEARHQNGQVKLGHFVMADGNKQRWQRSESSLPILPGKSMGIQLECVKACVPQLPPLAKERVSVTHPRHSKICDQGLSTLCAHSFDHLVAV